VPLGNRQAAAGAGFGTPVQVPVPAESLGFASAFGMPAGLTQPVAYGLPILPTASALLAAVALKRGQPAGPATDPEIEDFFYDALDLLAGTTDVEIRCEGGRATLTGSVAHKRQKRDVGEVAWAIPNVNDVQNNVTIAARRRSRAAGRESEGQPGPARKQT
jgi:hypothetical protein